MDKEAIKKLLDGVGQTQDLKKMQALVKKDVDEALNELVIYIKQSGELEKYWTEL